MSARPVGDPAALDEAARAILTIASKLDGMDGEIVHALPPEAFEGPGRGRHNTALRAAARRVEHASERLLALARQLSRGAVELRRSQQRWDAAEREREREREREAQRCAPTPRPR